MKHCNRIPECVAIHWRSILMGPFYTKGVTHCGATHNRSKFMILKAQVCILPWFEWAPERQLTGWMISQRMTSVTWRSHGGIDKVEKGHNPRRGDGPWHSFWWSFLCVECIFFSSFPCTRVWTPLCKFHKTAGLATFLVVGGPNSTPLWQRSSIRSEQATVGERIYPKCLSCPVDSFHLPFCLSWGAWPRENSMHWRRQCSLTFPAPLKRLKGFVIYPLALFFTVLFGIFREEDWKTRI